jgi:hypothetical protein
MKLIKFTVISFILTCLILCIAVSCTVTEQDKKNTATVDQYLAQYPLPDGTTIGYDASNFMVEYDDSRMQLFYKLVMSKKTRKEIDLCHEFPYGGMLELNVDRLIPQAIAQHKMINDILAELLGDTIIYDAPGSIALLSYDASNEDHIKLARTFDKLLSLEEKVWLYNIGGNQVITSNQTSGFHTQMAIKLYVMGLSTQRRLQAFMEKLKTEQLKE